MRIGIVAASNLRYSPYVFFYTSILDGMEGVEYELIFPNRHGIEDSYDGVACVLPWNGSVPTVLGYMLYARQVIGVIKKRRYDAVIVLTTNNAVFLGPWLCRHYAGRFLVDIRDYTHENIPPFYAVEKKVLAASPLNVISSDRFRRFLPPGDYSVCHNLPRDLTPRRAEKSSFAPEDTITIGYLGTGGYMDNCRALAQLVCADARFRLHLYGPQVLEEQIPQELYTGSQGRIRYCGSFTPDQKEGVLKSVDVLFNVYGNGILLDYALSNKLYDALCFRKVILTSPNTYMTDFAGPLAYAMDLSRLENLQHFHEFMEKLDMQALEAYADETLKRIVEEQETTRRRICSQIRLFAGEKEHE